KYDNQKTKRLEKLNQLIGLPINQTHYINGEDFKINSYKIKKIIKERGNSNKLHAFRISPKEKYGGTFPTIKKYGFTFKEFYKHFSNLNIDPNKAQIRVTDFRGELKYASVIIVGSEGIIGEVAKGTLYNLTYELEPADKDKVITFFLEYGKNLCLLSENKELTRVVNKILNFIRSKDKNTIAKLKKYNFPIHNNNYIGGYYEYIEAENGKCAFTDINNKKIANNLNIKAAINFLKGYPGQSKRNLIKGLSVNFSNKKIQGKVQIINEKRIKEFKPGNILVCESTNINYLPIMKKAKVIITDLGGITSHPAIIARELNIPCLVGTKIATQELKDGNEIEVDTKNGLVRILK
ncbi:MAG: hypothetical protein HQ538_01070, partial [Parcubacteria group bacterium]|nr:hypothetical protein [Parcubacteria group bacterium]